MTPGFQRPRVRLLHDTRTHGHRAATTGLALVPLVVLGDRPGHEIEDPQAVVILGGLFTSTTLNLFVVPSLYLRFGRSVTSASRRSPGAGVTRRVRGALRLAAARLPSISGRG